MDTFEVRGRHIGVLLLHPYVSLFSRLVLGGIFLFAGIVKLPHIETLIWEIEQYQILPEFLVLAFGYTLPILEITLGTLLVFGIILRASTMISGLRCHYFSYQV
jgi:uncharacterized membrane protein YphA (DoxX/SURF4 family)